MSDRRLARLAKGLVAALLMIVLLATVRGWTSAARPAPGPSAVSPGGRAPQPATAASPAVLPTAGISGHVREPDGGAAARAAVCAAASMCLIPNDNGAYTFDDLPSGTTFVVVTSASGRAPSMPARIQLGPGERRAGVDLVVQSGGVATRGRVSDALGGVVAGAAIAVSFGPDSGAKSVLECVVVDARGAPLADHFVEARRLAEQGESSAPRYDAIASGAITDSLGRFRLERLGAGDYFLRAFRPGAAEGSVASRAF